MEGVEFEFDGKNLTWHSVSSHGLEADVNKSLYGKAFVKGSGMYNFEKQKGGGVNFSKRVVPETRDDMPRRDGGNRFNLIGQRGVRKDMVPSDEAVREAKARERQRLEERRRAAENGGEPIILDEED